MKKIMIAATLITMMTGARTSLTPRSNIQTRIRPFGKGHSQRG
jgi:hypothetical protein